MRVLGVDLGIASCGWAVVEPDGEASRIVAAGVRCFDTPLVDDPGQPKSAVRRSARGQRRVIRRRRQRMEKVRAILHRFGLLAGVASEALRDAMQRVQLKANGDNVTPWRLRALAHDRLLSDDEFSVVIGHIARHRGFRSNSKRDAGANAADETSKMKKAMEETREGLAKYRSFGEMIESDPKSQTANATATRTIRTRPSDRTSKPSCVRSSRLNAASATCGQLGELETEVEDAAFTQRPLQDGEDKVGPCPFENRRRAHRQARAFLRDVPLSLPADQPSFVNRPNGIGD